MKTIIFPLTEEYTIPNILKWKKETIAKMKKNGYEDYITKVWKLDTLDVKEFIFDANDYGKNINNIRIILE